MMVGFFGALAIPFCSFSIEAASFETADLSITLLNAFLTSTVFPILYRKHLDSFAQSDQLFAAFMDHLPGFAWIKDAAGRYLYASKLLRQLSPYQNGWLGKTDGELWPADLAANHRATDLKVVASRETLETVESYFIGSEEHFLLVSKFPIFDGDGKVAMVGAVCVDITEQKRAEDALRTQKEILQKIFDHIPAMISLFDAHGRINLVNREWERWRGWSLQEILNHNVDLMAEGYPDREYRQKVFALAANSNGKPFELKTKVRDGRVLDTIWSIVNLSDGTKIGLGQDITERKQAEDALKESRRYLQALFDNSLDAILVINDEGRYIDANPAACSLLGYTREELMRLSFLDLTPAEYRQERWASWQQFLELGTQSGEYSTVRKDGMVIQLEFRAVANIQPGVHVSSARDITQRRHAQEAQREAEQKYRDIFENALDGIFQTSPDGRFVVANPALARMFGFGSPEELIRERADISKQHYVDPKRRDEFKRLLEEEGIVHHFEYEAYRKDGSRIWVSDNVHAMRDQNGKVFCYEGIANDITERKRSEQALRQAEQKYRELFENAKDAIYVHDLSGKYTSINRAAERLSGYPREEILGKDFSCFVAPEYAEHMRQNLCKKLRHEGETIYEAEVITKDGRRVPVEINSRLIYEEGVPVAVQGTARNVAERKRAEEALRGYSRQLILAQEAERQNIARELHDQIGQALTAIRINLETIRNSSNQAESNALIDEGVATVDEALQQVRDLSFELRPSLLDDLGLTAALRRYADRYAQRTGIQTKIAIGLESQIRLPRELETACFRIVQEALTNVARHAQAKNVSIDVRTMNGALSLAIKDDGIGFNLDSHTNGELPSSLGLRGMEERAHGVGGKLEIDSAPGKGTEVRVHFFNGSKRRE
jgi:PAS domain S-box-containing protein